MPIFERHAFRGFDKEVRELRDIINQMRDQSIELMKFAKNTLELAGDDYSAAKLLDKAINQNEIEADNKVYEIIAKYNPIAGEMRYILSMFKVAYIFERTADKIKNSIKRLCRINKTFPGQFSAELEAMIDIGVEMMSRATGLLDTYNADTMANVAEMKKTVSLHHKQALLLLQQVPVDQINSQESSDLHFVIKNIERVSDLMLDLAKVGYFISTGKKFERGA